MAFDKPEDFYQTYTAFKRLETPRLKDKHVRWFDREFWTPALCTTETAVRTARGVDGAMGIRARP